MSVGKRYRATVVIFNDSKVLLVRDRGRGDYSFPGGGFKSGESTVQAGAREVGEEIGGLDILSAKRCRECDFVGQRAKHKVCVLIVKGNPYIRARHELSDIFWWNMKDKIKTQGHVKYILSKLGK